MRDKKMGAKFTAWFNQLPGLIITFGGVKPLINLPNPPAHVIQTWQNLISQREEVLKELSIEHQNMPENSPPSSYPWIMEFIIKAQSIANSYPNGKEYLLPVANSLRDLIRYKILNTQQWVQSEWKGLLTKTEALIQNLY
jgi:hypothetical protein